MLDKGFAYILVVITCRRREYFSRNPINRTFERRSISLLRRHFGLISECNFFLHTFAYRIASLSSPID
jgi:hypothetical protein